MNVRIMKITITFLAALMIYLMLTGFSQKNFMPTKAHTGLLASSNMESTTKHIALVTDTETMEDKIINDQKVSLASNLKNTERINGNLYIWNTKLKDLSALSSLRKVDGDVYIKFNRQLQNIEGLANLTEISGDLFIHANYSLTNCCVLKTLLSPIGNKIKGNIFINNNKNYGNCQDEISIMRCR